MERAPLQILGDRLAALRWVDGECSRLLNPVPDKVKERLKRLHYLDNLQRAGRSVDAGNERGRAAFDTAWTGRGSDWAYLDAATSWIQTNGDLRYLAAQRPERGGYPDAVAALLARGEKAGAEFSGLLEMLKAGSEVVLGTSNITVAPLAAIAGRLRGWQDNMEQLSKWVAWRERADAALALGLAPLIERLSDSRLVTDAALATFEIAYYDTLLGAMIEAAPELGRFDGELHERHVLSFANLDRERIKAASLEVVRAHHKRIPPRDGAVGPLGVLRGEMARKRGHMPIRQLMQRAGAAVQALKPVMMMSPLSVAQFLTPGHVSFDLLVMDEASQIQPVDALGAIARARQVVVVGDERQLPPSSFFAKLTGSQEDDDGEGAQVADIESILGLFSARGLPQRMLRWHYRSRHQSLIAVSNNQFYENKLFIVPSPYTQEAGMGLAFHHVAGGVFEDNANKAEARAVAEAVIRHAKTHTELSLGVCAFSVTQRRAIQDELEVLRRANPDAEPYFQAHHAEPFFVKNLENVQGDERDVIMISVGYARNAQGYMAMRFGPLGAEGGERRLNVLISRAKRRCEVFASITDEDIDTERGRGKGVFAFKLFLHFARTGNLDIPRIGARDMDSLFEEQVARVLKERGYQVSSQVGIAGFFIDLAVGDAERPGRYLLGIECDGVAYHSSRSARDRDRLRQAVLEDHGWIIHRIWSYDWFQRPREQTERLIAAIDAARVELDARMELSLQRHRAVPIQVVTVDRGDVVEVGLMDADRPDASGEAYIEATIDRVGTYDLHETPIGRLAALVEQVVKVESPIHIDEVTSRLRDAWNLGRAGSRVQSAVEDAVGVALAQGVIRREGDFLLDPSALPRLRNRQNVLSASLRKTEMLPPSEIAAGMVEIIAINMGATDDELVGTLARRLGFKATSSQLRDILLKILEALLAQGKLQRRNGLVVLVDPEAVLAPALEPVPM